MEYVVLKKVKGIFNKKVDVSTFRLNAGKQELISTKTITKSDLAKMIFPCDKVFCLSAGLSYKTKTKKAGLSTRMVDEGIQRLFSTKFLDVESLTDEYGEKTLPFTILNKIVKRLKAEHGYFMKKYIIVDSENNTLKIM
jgi:hypothetical protein